MGLAQCYEFRSVRAGTDGIFRTSMQTGMGIASVPLRINFSQFRLVSGIPIISRQFRSKCNFRLEWVLPLFFSPLLQPKDIFHHYMQKRFEFHKFYSTSQHQIQPKNPQQWSDEHREREVRTEGELGSFFES